MLKLLVVDDNNRDRRVAREMSIWQDLNIQVIGEAANGHLALEQIEHLGVPDIVLTDVSMPYMDGMTLSKKLQQDYPRVHVLFMSYYEEFEYARNAISVHADAYIVKPLREKEVRAAVEKALDVIYRERNRQSEQKDLQKRLEQAMPVLREDFMRSLLLEGEFSKEEIREQLDYFGLRAPERCCVIVIRKRYKGLMDMKERYLRSLEADEQIREATRDAAFWAMRISDLQSIVVIDSSRTEDAMVLAVNLVDEIRETANVDPRIGVSETGTVEQLHALYLQALSTAETDYFSQKIPVLCFRDVTASEYRSAEMPDPSRLMEQLEALLLNGSEEEIDELLDPYLKGSHGGAYLRYFAIMIVNALQFLLQRQNIEYRDILGESAQIWKKLENFNTILSIRNWLFNLIAMAQQYVRGKASHRDRQIADEILKKIEISYADPISVEDVAESVYLGAKQANNIFKRETGKSIFDSIIETRIRKSKELLSDPKLRIGEIAMRVGYVNQSYFCQLFRKSTGLSPRDWRYHFGRHEEAQK